ncbi:MAG: hypothetical protein DBX52_05975 [Clostridiales bacterium]|nr:MAG: hypothetical protein DBX52_05975 [Clostridiales bacterium]
MSGIAFTAQQENAIESRGDALLISAAAGSGKTAVLVERVLRYLIEEKGEIQRLIIMTYTRAAADELRLKIKTAAEEYQRRNGGSAHLLRQSALIDSAEIGTIHSICLNLITRYFQQLDLDPRCRLIDDAAEQAMAEEEAERLMEQLYGEKEEQTQLFLRCFGAGRSDVELRDLLIGGLRFLENQPLPEDYIRRACAPYRQTGQGLFACFAEDGLYQYLSQRVAELRAEYAFLVHHAGMHPYLREFPAFMAFIEAEQQQFDALPALLEKRDYNRFRAYLGTVRFEPLRWNSLTEKNGDSEAQNRFRQMRERFKKSFLELKEQLEQPEREELRRLRQQETLLEAYFSICMRLLKRLSEERRRQGLISYQDMEQMAVRLLVAAYDPGQDMLTPTPLAKQLRQDYDEIIIDEFQDTNRAQDLIFRALSQEGKNLFMVGDMKQSIYRFRGAEPEIFSQKRRNAVPFTERKLGAPTVLELNMNFRSHPGVLRFVNSVFENIMSRELGGVAYEAGERLAPGRTFDEQDECCAELHWMEPQQDPDTGRKMEVTVQNARYIAQLIRRMVRERQPLRLPGGGSRPVAFQDFAILLRTVSGTAGIFERELLRAGVPVSNYNEGARFYDLEEVQSILAYLLVLNNPYDDVALVSLLYGDYFRFSVGELASMREKDRPLYENLKAAAARDEKARRACEIIERFRQMAGILYVYDLLYRIYEESGIFAVYAARAGGAEKSANLELLAEEARLFEKEGYRGLYAFVQHIRLSQAGMQSGARLEAAENSVQIMSIHKSKGLEFPICILGDGQKKLNLRDSSARILLHPRYGAATEHQDPELFFRCRSLMQTVLANQMVTDNISEEERVLYVALTRAKSRVILVSTVEKQTMEKWVLEGTFLNKPFPLWMLKRKDASYARWLFSLCAASQEGEALRSTFRFSAGTGRIPLHAAFLRAEGRMEQRPDAQAEEEPPRFNCTAFHKRLDWDYPHLAAVRLPAKLSVSELKGIREADAEAQPLLEEQLRPERPRFASNFAPRGNEIGNALHQALQFGDFLKLREDPAGELSRLVAEGFILEKQRRLIPLNKIRAFTQSKSFLNLLEADYYNKEERFIFPIPADALFGPEAQGEILIQGVLDCYAVKGRKAVILDYKTDRVQHAQELIDRYRIQMDLYEQALRRVKGLEVIRREIYSFSLEETVCL